MFKDYKNIDPEQKKKVLDLVAKYEKQNECLLKYADIGSSKFVFFENLDQEYYSKTSYKSKNFDWTLNVKLAILEEGVYLSINDYSDGQFVPFG